MSHVVLATTSAAFEQRVRRATGADLNGTMRRWHDEIMFIDATRAVREVAEGGPEVVAIGPNVDLQPALDLARAFHSEHPEIAVVLIAEPSWDFWEQALRAGVHDVLMPDADDDQIRDVFYRAMETAERRRVNLLDEVGEKRPTGRVITLLAPKGGSGKTALATNMAIGLSYADAGKVALVDLDLQFGDVAGSLSLRPQNTIGDLAASQNRVSATTLKVFLTPVRDRLFVLCAPDSPAAGEEVSEATVEQTIRLLADEFEFTVVDTAAGLTEYTLAAIELSTDLMLVCDLSAAAVRALRKVIDALDRLGIDQPRRHFVLNRADSRVGIDADEAARVVGMPVSVAIPSARDVPLSMNQGTPVVESSPRAAVSKQFIHASLLFARPTESKGNGFFKLRSRK